MIFSFHFEYNYAKNYNNNRKEKQKKKKKKRGLNSLKDIMLRNTVAKKNLNTFHLMYNNFRVTKNFDLST